MPTNLDSLSIYSRHRYMLKYLSYNSGFSKTAIEELPLIYREFRVKYFIYPNTTPATNKNPGISRVAKEQMRHQYLAAIAYTGFPVKRARTKNT